MLPAMVELSVIVPDPERGSGAGGTASRAHRHPRAVGTLVRNHRDRRRQHRRQLRRPEPAAGPRPAAAGDPLPAELRPDRGVLGRVRPRPRPPDRHLRRRSPERPPRHPRDGRKAGKRLRHRLRLAEGPEGRVRVADRSLDAGEPADFVGDRRPPARLRLLAEGVPRRGRQAAAALRRDAPVHPGDRQRAGGRDRRGRRQPPLASARHVELRHLADDSRRARSADGEVPAQLLDAAAADLRADRVHDGAAGRARRSVARLREVRRSRTGDRRPAAAPAVGSC